VHCCQFHLHFRSSFCAYILSQKNYKAKLLVKKSQEKHFVQKAVQKNCWWNWHLLSISSTFYPRLFRTKVFSLLRVWLWMNFCTKKARVKCWWNWHLNGLDEWLWTFPLTKWNGFVSISLMVKRFGSVIISSSP
jgi:hypothetical protein